ncbi:MAG TPA: putative manganese-dependent inorganic diphosphatase [Roseiflexaceae bacterium]|nr:putative manganese-dependent inorganic diphosphatase [Roseiflexaceae bacterium]
MTIQSPPAVLVIGHHHPDTDAVCSALAYASFYQWQTGRDTIACHLDDLAPETAWLLKHLGLEPPRAIADVHLRVADVMESRVPLLLPDQTLREAGLLMVRHHVRALPVIDHERRLIGLVQSDTLAARYLDQLQLPEEINLPVAALQHTLEGELLVGPVDAVLNDRVWIATMTGETAQARIGTGDVVIVGDQQEVQEAAIASGAGCLILTDNAPLDDALRAAAALRGTIVLRTRHSPFAAALLLQQSVPVDRVMERSLPAVTVHRDTLLQDAKAQLRRGNLTGLAVIDDAGIFHGMLLRRHLAEQAKRQIILTDHNHPDQAAPGVAESQVIAIVDHHNLGGMQTLQPLSIHCEPVGSTCTLIAELFRWHGAPLTPALAGAMLGAILSDTVQFRSPTTTQRDREIATWLEERGGQRIEALAQRLFRARLPDPLPPPRWWVGRDLKIFTFGGRRFSISQVELTAIAEVMPAPHALRQALADLVAEHGLTSAFVLLTDILEQSSILLAANSEGDALAERAFGKSLVDGQMVLPGVMSRKKQVVPPMAAALI